MDELAQPRQHHREIRSDPEYAPLSLVPDAVAANEVPIPGAHLARRQSEIAALLALLQLAVGTFELRGPVGDAPLELGIELLELPRLAVQLGEDLHLGAQHLGDDRHRNIVDRSHLVAAQAIHLGQMNGGDEDDRRFAKARMVADHRGELEAVELGHADVHQHHRDFRLEQLLQRLAARRGLDQVLVDVTQDDFVAQQLRGLVVDQQDVDFLVAEHVSLRQRCSHIRNADSSCSVLTGFAR